MSQYIVYVSIALSGKHWKRNNTEKKYDIRHVHNTYTSIETSKREREMHAIKTYLEVFR